MAEPSFERHVQRLYAEAPLFPDAPLFAADVQRRLDRGWTLRRGLIGVAGVAGGVIAAVQFVGSNFTERMSLASEGLTQRVHEVESWVSLRTGWQLDPHALPMGGEAIWLVAGLAAMGIALLAARVFETF
jgi:hypothetical protein